MDELPNEDRPESLPQQVSRLAIAIHQRATGLPPWCGPVLWVAVGITSLIAIWVHRLLISNGTLGAASYSVLSIPLFAAGTVSGTLPVFAGLWSGLVPGPLLWRLLSGLAVVVLMSCLTAPAMMIHLLQSHLTQWGAWFAIALLVRWRARLVFSASDPQEADPTRWSLFDLLILTTVAATIAAIAGVMLQAKPIASAQIAATATWTSTLVVLVLLLLGNLALMPLLRRLFPINPKPLAAKRVLVGSIITLLMLVGISTGGFVYLTNSQTPPLPGSPPLWGYALTGMLDSIFTISGCIAGGLWLRWWGYRLRLLPAE